MVGGPFAKIKEESGRMLRASVSEQQRLIGMLIGPFGKTKEKSERTPRVSVLEQQF